MDRTDIAMCTAGIALLVIGVLASKSDIARARGLDRIVALANLSFALPLAVFGTLHLFGPQYVTDLVPDYMPFHMFWVYFVGCALIAASVSIATGILLRWSGLMVGILMFLFVVMIYIPGVMSEPDNRIIWTIVFRESSFGAAGWLLAGSAKNGWHGRTRSTLIITGRVLVALALLFFGVQHLLHPLGLPGVPLKKEIPNWVPGRMLIDYVTGAGLLAAGGSILLPGMTRNVAACLAGWILLTLMVIYVPVMIMAQYDPDAGIRLQGINYFADTLLFTGVILALAKASPATGTPGLLHEK